MRLLLPISLCLLSFSCAHGEENSLEKNSPFIPSVSRMAGVTSQDIEFRGVLKMDENTFLFSLLDKTTTPNKSIWLDPTDADAPYRFKEYNAAEGKLTIEVAGKTHHLTLNKPSDKPGSGTAGGFGGGRSLGESNGAPGFPSMVGMAGRERYDAMAAAPDEGFGGGDEARFPGEGAYSGGLSPAAQRYGSYGNYAQPAGMGRSPYSNSMQNPYGGNASYGYGGYGNGGGYGGAGAMPTGLPSYEDEE